MKRLHDSTARFFGSQTAMIVSAVIGIVLWIANALFNLLAADYLAFAINIMYAVCISAIMIAAVKNENNTLQGSDRRVDGDVSSGKYQCYCGDDRQSAKPQSVAVDRERCAGIVTLY